MRLAWRAEARLRNLEEGQTDCIGVTLSEGTARVLIEMDERAARAIARELGIPVA